MIFNFNTKVISKNSVRKMQGKRNQIVMSQRIFNKFKRIVGTKESSGVEGWINGYISMIQSLSFRKRLSLPHASYNGFCFCEACGSRVGLLCEACISRNNPQEWDNKASGRCWSHVDMGLGGLDSLSFLFKSILVHFDPF